MAAAGREYNGLTAGDAFAALRETIGPNTKELLRRVRDPKSYPHAAALAYDPRAYSRGYGSNDKRLNRVGDPETSRREAGAFRREGTGFFIP